MNKIEPADRRIIEVEEPKVVVESRGRDVQRLRNTYKTPT